MKNRTLKELKALIAQRAKTTPDGIVRLDVTQPELALLREQFLKTGYSVAQSLSKEMQARGIMRFAIQTPAWRDPQPKRRQAFQTLKAAMSARNAARNAGQIDPSEIIVLVRQANGKGPATLETWDALKFHQRKGECFSASEKWHNDSAYATQRRLHQFRIRGKGGKASREIKRSDGTISKTYTDAQILAEVTEYKRQHPDGPLSMMLNYIRIKHACRPYLNYSDPEKLRGRLKKIFAPLSPKQGYQALK
ncbi:MAG: hypothetical protein KKE37_06440 [Verrucomicrobia bacterium]|nr:hypothetical protein [Verrucomicrobiota bacterium]MBU4428976.1 hypothetical protein [Verrucomicrobiota bacterium]MCG2680915.1 hypothetical protein [Kiritimatiellia bacterium]